jgi:hypothetical protein
MAEITKEELRASAARGLDLRDIVGAWLVCALVASIALAVSSHFHAPPASAAVADCFGVTHTRQRGNALHSEKMT